MDIVRPLQIGFNHRVLEHNRRFFFTASATMGFQLQTGATLLEFDYLKDALTCMGEQPMLDWGMPKPRAEFLVNGCLFPPGNKPASEGWVKVRLGKREKQLYVFGAREWRNFIPTTAQPFTRMAIDYGHAFGGKNYPKNPTGIGFKDSRLPCIENPTQLVGSPSDTPDPAGFSALDVMWPQRSRFCGTYDSSYMKKYYPGYPEDFNWLFFNSAPEDQWLDGFFKGDESFAIHHMHPEIPVIEGRLPGIVCRCFLQHAIEDDPGMLFTELPLNLDTVWFFPEKLTGMLIWRGVSEVKDDEAEQIKAALVAYEHPHDPPKDTDYYLNALEVRLKGHDFLKNYLNTQDLIPVGAKCAMEILQEMAFSDQEPKGELVKNLDARIASVQTMLDEKLAEAKVQVAQSAGSVEGFDLSALNQALQPQGTGSDPETEALNRAMETIMPGILTGKLQLKEFSFDKLHLLLEEIERFTAKKRDQAQSTIDEATAAVIKQRQDVEAMVQQQPELQQALEQLRSAEQQLSNTNITKKPPT